MKVYAVLGSYNYEGYVEPLGIFTTLALATEFGEKFTTRFYDGVEILEYELDVHNVVTETGDPIKVVKVLK